MMMVGRCSYFVIVDVVVFVVEIVMKSRCEFVRVGWEWCFWIWCC